MSAIPAELQNDIERLQAIIVGRIFNDPLFSTVTVLDEDKGDRIADLLQALASMTVKGGKKGAAVYVCMPFFDIENPAGPGPRIELSSYVRCVEKPLLNRGEGGSGIHAETMALRIVRLCHDYIIQGLEVTLKASKGDPVMYDNKDREVTVTIKTSLQLDPLRKCALPRIKVISPTSCTITCASNDAVIWYTTDKSFPAPGNAAAHQVPAPDVLVTGDGEAIVTGQGNEIVTPHVINVANCSLVQAVAYPNNNHKVASDLAAQTIK